MPATDANCFDGDDRYFDVRPIAHPEELMESGHVQRDVDAILVKIDPLHHPREQLGTIV